MKYKIITSVIVGVLLSAAILMCPNIGKASSNGTFSSVETGTGTVTGNGSQNYLEYCDSYSSSYSSAPRVLLSTEEVTGDSITTAMPPTVEVYANGTSSFCARLGTRDNSNWGNGFEIRVNWVAIGN